MLQGCFLKLRQVIVGKGSVSRTAQISSGNMTGELQDRHPTTTRDLDSTNDHDFMRLDTPFPDTPLRGQVLRIHFTVLEESKHRSHDVLRELGQSNRIALVRFVADWYMSLERTIPTPL